MNPIDHNSQAFANNCDGTVRVLAGSQQAEDELWKELATGSEAAFARVQQEIETTNKELEARLKDNADARSAFRRGIQAYAKKRLEIVVDGAAVSSIDVLKAAAEVNNTALALAAAPNCGDDPFASTKEAFSREHAVKLLGDALPLAKFTRELRDTLQQCYATVALDATDGDEKLSQLGRWLKNLPATTKEEGLEYLAYSDEMVRSMHRKAQYVFKALLADEGDDATKQWLDIRKEWIERFSAKVAQGLVQRKTGQNDGTEKDLDNDQKKEFAETVDDWKERFAVTENTAWVASLQLAKVSPVDAAEFVYASFIYTVDGKACDCTDQQACDAKRDEEKKGDGEKKKSHIKKLEGIPHGGEENQAWGYNRAIWAVFNWAARVVNTPGTEPKIRELCLRPIKSFKIWWELMDQALNFLPSERGVVFRGVGLALADSYTANTKVPFAPFTSTSFAGVEALNYTKRGASWGTFFNLRTASSARIDFASFYPEQLESLLPLFTIFHLKQKTSKTILSMLQCNFDIVVLLESGASDNISDNEAVGDYIRSVRQTDFIFAKWLSTYVEGRVADRPPPQPVDATKELFKTVEAVIADETSNNLVCLGSAGSGKTSASLALYCHFSRHGTKNGKAMAPIFVPLPSVKRLCRTEALGADELHPITETVLNISGLQSESQLRELLSTFHTVLILESLDEVDDLSTAALQRGIMTGNDLFAKSTNVSIIITCRAEVESAFKVPAAKFLWGEAGTKTGSSATTNVRHLMPFYEEDVKKFATVYVNAEAEKIFTTPTEEEKKSLHKFVDSGLSSFPEQLKKNPVTFKMGLEIAFRDFSAASRSSAGNNTDINNKAELYSRWIYRGLDSSGEADETEDEIHEKERVAVSPAEPDSPEKRSSHQWMVGCNRRNPDDAPKPTKGGVASRCASSPCGCLSTTAGRRLSLKFVTRSSDQNCGKRRCATCRCELKA